MTATDHVLTVPKRARRRPEAESLIASAAAAKRLRVVVPPDTFVTPSFVDELVQQIATRLSPRYVEIVGLPENLHQVALDRAEEYPIFVELIGSPDPDT